MECKVFWSMLFHPILFIGTFRLHNCFCIYWCLFFHYLECGKIYKKEQNHNSSIKPTHFEVMYIFRVEGKYLITWCWHEADEKRLHVLYLSGGEPAAWPQYLRQIFWFFWNSDKKSLVTHCNSKENKNYWVGSLQLLTLVCCISKLLASNKYDCKLPVTQNCLSKRRFHNPFKPPWLLLRCGFFW